MEEYDIGPLIGIGAFSHVKKARKFTDQSLAAIKIFDKSRMGEKDQENVLDECSFLNDLRHPRIVQFIDYYDEPDFQCIVLECMDTDLYLYLNENFDKFTEDDIRDIFRRSLEAVAYCHENNIAHMDIKPENLLLKLDEDGNVTDIKLTDFGMSHRIDPSKRVIYGGKLFGTVGYMSPELYLNKCEDLKKVDAYSMGVLLYNLVTGMMPHKGSTKDKVINQVKNLKCKPKYNNKLWKQCSPAVKDLTMALLDKDADKRIDIKTALEHPWLKE